nr:MAG TPA: hypothetical protein [Caudoviricetes sp.]
MHYALFCSLRFVHFNNTFHKKFIYYVHNIYCITYVYMLYYRYSKGKE